tara:strand:- start:166 stop:987 length:822 start_codon:yes stop_codon:yes gene_type:complete
MKIILALGMIVALSGCATQRSLETLSEVNTSPINQPSPIEDRLLNVPPLDGDIIPIALYEFQDFTGQRKPGDGVANLSSAVTQGSAAWVIQALQDVGDEGWFQVIERVGMDNLIKERQLIRNTRDLYEKDTEGGPQPLQPLIFAGLILEGGIVGYDSNTAVGGAGARFMGLGVSTEYRIDTVTVVMRLVSVASGKVLISIATEKTVASYRSGADVFKFLDLGTNAIEIENGYSVNEPVNYAVRAAIEQGVIELVYEGVEKELWNFKEEEETND